MAGRSLLDGYPVVAKHLGEMVFVSQRLTDLDATLVGLLCFLKAINTLAQQIRKAVQRLRNVERIVQF